MAPRAPARIRQLIFPTTTIPSNLLSMQNIIVEKPYKFIPPHHGSWLPWLVQKLRVVDIYLNRCEGIESHEVRGLEHLQDSLRQGHGILLAPNHCRYSDPIAIGWLVRQVNVYIYSMASWHLFNQSRAQGFAMRMCGAFSVYREGVDRQSLNTAVDVLTQAKRPLVVFPEGTVFRTNDILQPLMDGVSFLARTAAKRRAKHSHGKVVIHPVAIKYLFKGDVRKSIEPVLADIEQRLTLNHAPRPENVLERISRIHQAMLALQEIQYAGGVQPGCIAVRQSQLVEHLLAPLETQWLGRVRAEPIMPRVKQLRSAIVPKLFLPETTDSRRSELWQQLTNVYMAQQIASHPSDYLDTPTDTRLLETVESFEEDLTDRSRIHRPLHAILELGPAIEVDHAKPPREADDPLMSELADSLKSMLGKLSTEANLI